MDCQIRPLTLELRDTFRISREASDQRQNVLLELQDESGALGRGEAAPSRFYEQNAESVTDALRDMTWPADTDPFMSEDILNAVKPQLVGQSSTLAAVDVALHDLIGQRLKVPIYRLWGLNSNRAPVTSFTIGIASLDPSHRTPPPPPLRWTARPHLQTL